MKRFITLVVAGLSVMMLAACGNLSNSSMSSGGDTNKASTQLTGQASDNDYEGVIKNGHYQTSKSRGVTNSQDNNIYNLKSFEAGMLSLSKQVFPTKKYIFQEGQYLSATTVQNWLGRKSAGNPTGLNPASNGSTSPTGRNPIYVQTLEEQDYMTQANNKLLLGGMTIGIGINSVDSYQKTKYGATYQTKISQAAGEAYGKKVANTVLQRLRQQKALKNIPIVIALYRQAPDDSLVGGTFTLTSTNKAGSTTVSGWKTVNQKNYVFPIISGQSGPNSNDESSFDNFKTQVQNFFPNLSGVTAQAQYNNGQLAGMNVNITTQFYSQTEIISFTQFLQQAAQKYLPASVPIDITVQSTSGMQSFLSRDPGGKRFTSHVFNSY